VSGHDPSPAHAGGRVTPDRGFPPHIPHLRVRVSRDRGQCLATPPLGHGENPTLWLLVSVPLGAHSGAQYGAEPTGSEPGEPRAIPIRRSPTAVIGGVGSLGGTLVVTRGDDIVGRDRVLPAPRVVRVPHPRVGLPYLPQFPAFRGGMSPSAAPDVAAAMAVDREAEGAGALLGPEEDIDDDVLSNLLAASWPTPALVDDKYGRYPWTPVGGSMVEQRFDAVDSRLMTSIWTTIRGMYGSLCAVPEGTVTVFPFLRTREDWRVFQVLRHLAVRDIPPEVGDKPHFSW